MVIRQLVMLIYNQHTHHQFLFKSLQGTLTSNDNSINNHSTVILFSHKVTVYIIKSFYVRLEPIMLKIYLPELPKNFTIILLILLGQ